MAKKNVRVDESTPTGRDQYMHKGGTNMWRKSKRERRVNNCFKELIMPTWRVDKKREEKKGGTDQAECGLAFGKSKGS